MASSSASASASANPYEHYGNSGLENGDDLIDPDDGEFDFLILRLKY